MALETLTMKRISRESNKGLEGLLVEGSAGHPALKSTAFLMSAVKQHLNIPDGF